MKKIIHKPYYLEIIDIVPNRYIELVIAIEMRKRKFTFDQIGEHFGVSKQAARQLIRKYEAHIVSLGGEPLKDRKHKTRRTT